MKAVAYISSASMECLRIVQGASGSEFKPPRVDELCVEVEKFVDLPAYWDGTELRSVHERPGFGYIWKWWPSFTWVFDQDVADEEVLVERANALSHIDTEAGRARLRYITSVPGQAETYTRKEQQAREWSASGFAGPAPSFIAAEAAALDRDPQSVAQEVIDLADYWADVKGPEIEATRRKWKVAVSGAQTIEAVTAALASATAELGSL